NRNVELLDADELVKRGRTIVVEPELVLVAERGTYIFCHWGVSLTYASRCQTSRSTLARCTYPAAVSSPRSRGPSAFTRPNTMPPCVNGSPVAVITASAIARAAP